MIILCLLIQLSDHGMAESQNESYVELGDYIDTKNIDDTKSIYSIVSHIYPVSNDLVNIFRVELVSRF